MWFESDDFAGYNYIGITDDDSWSTIPDHVFPYFLAPELGWHHLYDEGYGYVELPVEAGNFHVNEYRY